MATIINALGEIHPFILSFWGVAIMSIVATIIIKKLQLTGQELLLKRKVATLTLWAATPIGFLLMVSFFDQAKIFMPENGDALAKIFNKFAHVIYDGSQIEWLFIAYSCANLVVVLMFAIPKYVEAHFEGVSKTIIYVLMTGGFYIPYHLLSTLITPKNEERLKRGVEVIHDPYRAEAILKKKLKNCQVA